MKGKWTIVIMCVAVGLILFSSSPSWAQRGTSGSSGGFSFDQPAHRLEIIPMYGYTWTGSQSGYYSGYNGELDFKDSDFWGIALDISAKPGVQARLLYRRQDTRMTWKQAGSTEDVGDIGVEYWHIGAVGGMRNGNVLPYTGLTLGGTRYIAGGEDSWKFSIILSLGAKVYLNEKIGLMVGGQVPFTFTDAFVGVGTGGMSLGGTGIVQFDVVAGLIIMI